VPERNERFPNGWQASCLVLALFFAQMPVGAAVHDAQGVLSLTPSQSDVLVSVLGNGLLFVFIMHAKGLSYRELFHPSRTSARATTALVVPAVLMLVPSLILLVSALETVLVYAVPMSFSEQAMFERMSTDDLATALFACVVAPAVEEMLFRGVILRSFLLQYRRLPSILGSAALFGIAHLNIYQFLAALVLGTLLGWLYERSRSLIPCIALHACYNFGVTVVDWTAPQSQASFAVWSGSLLLGALGAMLLVRMLRTPTPAP
jgi:membrane protease YdiL (CAAX protease family)